MTDCVRHGFPFVPTNDPKQPYHVVRCDHLGTRFVVEIANQFSGHRAIDYVEDVEGSVIVEANSFTVDDPPDRVDGAWQRLVAKMEAGIKPDPEA
jgi:hypothetical protein